MSKRDNFLSVLRSISLGLQLMQEVDTSPRDMNKFRKVIDTAKTIDDVILGINGIMPPLLEGASSANRHLDGVEISVNHPSKSRRKSKTSPECSLRSTGARRIE